MLARCVSADLNIREPDVFVYELAQELKCSEFLASLLWMKGINQLDKIEEGRAWISPNLSVSMDGVDLGQAASAAAGIFAQIKEGSRVLVYGDYDVDGITATATVLELALLKKAKVRYYIPHRFEQGYGLHAQVVEMIAKVGCDLLIVVDCGTQDIEAVSRAKAHGIPVIIFDHHMIQGKTADCDALVNPQLDGNLLARQLCAAGVVWSWAWKYRLAPEDWLLQRLQLTALATIADCVSLSSPVNRAIVREGLTALRENPRRGLSLLMQKLEVNPLALDAETLSMKIIPCLNAAGRLESADVAMKILFPVGDLEQQVDHLIQLNQKRRTISSKIIQDVENKSQDGFKFVLSGDDWPVGVLSSVASRISNDRGTPIVLAAATESVIRGTLRMPEGGDAVALLKEIASDLSTWGGHRLAAGFSVDVDRWPHVRQRIETLMQEVEIIPQRLELLSWAPERLSMEMWKEAESIGPFGMGNPYPLLFHPQEGPFRSEPLGKNGKHVRIKINQTSLLGFGGETLLQENPFPTGWVYRPKLETWKNITNLQFVLERVVL